MPRTTMVIDALRELKRRAHKRGLTCPICGRDIYNADQTVDTLRGVSHRRCVVKPRV